MNLTECPNCKAPGDQLMELDNGLIYCPVHKGACDLGDAPIVHGTVGDWATPTPDVAEFEQGRAVTKVHEAGPIETAVRQYVDVGGDMEEAPPAGPPLALRVGIITGLAVLFSTFDFDADDLVQVLKSGPTAVIDDDTNDDVKLRAGVAMLIASVIETFDIEPDEIEVMAETLLSMSDTNQKETVTE